MADIETEGIPNGPKLINEGEDAEEDVSRSMCKLTYFITDSFFVGNSAHETEGSWNGEGSQ